MKTYKEVKQEYNNKLVEKQVELIKLENIIDAIKDLKNKALGEKTVEKINIALNGVDTKNRLCSHDTSNVWIYVEKQYDFNDQKTCKIYYKKEQYKNERITELYDCITDIDDLKIELAKVIEYRKGEILRIKESGKSLMKNYKLTVKMMDIVKEFNELDFHTRYAIQKGSNEYSYRIHFSN